MTGGEAASAFGNGPDQMGLSILRIRISPDSTQWGIELPTAKRATLYGAIILASPWTPPASMKDNGSLTNGGSLLPGSYSAYTTHLLDFASFMESNSAPLYAISLQNEPDWAPDYESCVWTASDFVDYLTVEGSNFGSLQLVAPESLNFNHSLSDPFLSNATTEQYVDIVAGHLYGVNTPQDYPLARSLGKELWMTEHYTDSTNDANDWPLAMEVSKEIHDSMVANYSAYIWWYIRRSYGLLTEDGNVSKRGYNMAQYSKFVRPDYIRIDVTENPATDLYVTAYKDNEVIVVVAVNMSTSPATLTINLPMGTVVSGFTPYTTTGTMNVSEGSVVSVISDVASASIEAQSVTTFVSTNAGSGSSSSCSSSSSSSGAPNVLDVELEDLSGQANFAPFKVQEDILFASGGCYIVWPNNGSNQILDPASDGATGQVAIDFTLSEMADVQFDIGANFSSADDDSFHYKLDDGTWQLENTSTSLPVNFELLQVTTFTGLSAGAHTLTIERREDGAELDKVTLTASTGTISGN